MRKLLLTILLALFILPVLGQVLVVLFAPSWLPPMETWYSGLLPYPLLLSAQILIIALMIHMIHRPPPSRRWPIVAFATVSALAMIVRYAILRTHEIPVIFHLVLATFLFVCAAVRHRRNSDVPAALTRAPSYTDRACRDYFGT